MDQMNSNQYPQLTDYSEYRTDDPVVRGEVVPPELPEMDLDSTVQVTLAKRILLSGSNRVVCLGASTSVPISENEQASVSDLALRLSDGTNVALSLKFFNDDYAGGFTRQTVSRPSRAPRAALASAPPVRVTFEPMRYTTSKDDWRLGYVLFCMALSTVVLGCVFYPDQINRLVHLPIAGKMKGALPALVRLPAEHRLQQPLVPARTLSGNQKPLSPESASNGATPASVLASRPSTKDSPTTPGYATIKQVGVSMLTSHPLPTAMAKTQPARVGLTAAKIGAAKTAQVKTGAGKGIALKVGGMNAHGAKTGSAKVGAQRVGAARSAKGGAAKAGASKPGSAKTNLKGMGRAGKNNHKQDNAGSASFNKLDYIARHHKKGSQQHLDSMRKGATLIAMQKSDRHRRDADKHSPKDSRPGKSHAFYIPPPPPTDAPTGAVWMSAPVYSQPASKKFDPSSLERVVPPAQ